MNLSKVFAFGENLVRVAGTKSRCLWPNLFFQMNHEKNAEAVVCGQLVKFLRAVQAGECPRLRPAAARLTRLLRARARRLRGK